MKHQEMHAMQHDAMRRLGIEDHDQAPPLANFEETADKRVRLGLLIRQLITDQGISVSQEQVRAHLEEMCSGYENPDAMVDMYMNNPKLLEQVEPTVLEQLAIDWLAENGKSKSTQVSFTDYMDS
jgi:trigger factor